MVGFFLGTPSYLVKRCCRASPPHASTSRGPLDRVNLSARRPSESAAGKGECRGGWGSWLSRLAVVNRAVGLGHPPENHVVAAGVVAFATSLLFLKRFAL